MIGWLSPALVGAVMAAPWLTVLPVHGALAVAAHIASLLAAYHGAGLLVGRLAGRRVVNPWLAMQWGAAALIGLSGIAIVAGVGTLNAHAVLVFGFAAVHTGSLAAGFGAASDRVAVRLAGSRAFLVPSVLLGVLGAISVLGAAGEPLAQPFDDEANVLAQVARVLDTGALADPIGYARSAQLGGQIALAAVASGAGDGFAGLVEPLALVLALGLVVSQIRARGADAALWATIAVVAGFALAVVPIDPLPCWTSVGLVTALYATLDDASSPTSASGPPALPIALLAGALIALRYELAPIASVALVATWWRYRFDHLRTAILIGGAFAVDFPLLVARMVAWRTVPAIAHAQLASPGGGLLIRLALAAVIAVPAAGVLRLIAPSDRPGLRTAAVATAAGLAGVAVHLTAAGAYSSRLAWPIAISFALVWVIELAKSRTLVPAVMIVSLVLCALIEEGREAPGRLRWSRRLAVAATDLEVLRKPPGELTAAYASLLARVPAGATVAVWVGSPEQLDYAHHRIVDLRTPIAARLRRHRWEPHPAVLEGILGELSASFLIVEDDDYPALYTQTDLMYRLLCQPAVRRDRPFCADDLEAIALHHPVVARAGSAALIDLRP